MVVNQYVQSALFLLLGSAAVRRWARNRERREEHLAWAAVMYAGAQLMLALQATLFTETNARIPPRAWTVVWNILLFCALYAFLVFLADFVRSPRWARVLAVVATTVNLAFAVVLRPEIVLVGGSTLVRLPARNPIPYDLFVVSGVVYIAGTFCVLAAAFAVYGLGSRGMARLRMLAIGGGFALLLAAVGILPLFLYGRPSPTTRGALVVVQTLSLGAAPLLYLGFTPPRRVRDRITRAPTGPATAEGRS